MFDFENLSWGQGVQHSNGFIRLRISTSIKVIIEHFSLALTVSRYYHINFCNLENVGQGHKVTLALTTFDGKNVTSYLITIVMFARSDHHLRDIRKSNKMSKIWPWKWRSRSRKRKAGLAPFDWNVLFHMGDFIFRILATWEHKFRQTG